MSLNFNDFANNNNNLYVYNKSVEKKIKSSLNCVRVGIVDEFYPNEHVVKVRIANKMLVGLNKDGSHIDDDYAPIFAKVYYMGWKETQVTYPIEVGTEGIVLFNDRELESWYLNGEINSLSSTRMHDITDSIFIAGLHSMPNIIETIFNCLNLVFQSTNISLKSDKVQIDTVGSVEINTNTLQSNSHANFNGNLNVNGNLSSSNGASGVVLAGSSLLTFMDGILVSIS